MRSSLCCDCVPLLVEWNCQDPERPPEHVSRVRDRTWCISIAVRQTPNGGWFLSLNWWLLGMKKQFLASFNKSCSISKICDEYKALILAVVTEPTLHERFKSDSFKQLCKAWSGAGSRFEALQTFAAGIGTVMLTTLRIEGDFSLMNHLRDEYCAALTDFPLEGVMHAKQYIAILASAQSL